MSSAAPGERFRRRRFGRGYDGEAVESFLAPAELGAITAAEVTHAMFRSVYKDGYDAGEVDAALEELAKRLTAEGRVGSPPTESDAQPRSWLCRLLGR